MKVEFYKHSLGTDEIALLTATCSSLFTTTGPRTREFEEAFAAFLGVEGALGLSSCTAAMFLALKAWDIGPGDVVVVPAMTFIATANAVLHTGAEVVFADCEADSGLIDLRHVETLLEQNDKIRAVIPVHLYGHMVDVRALRNLTCSRNIKILEDAAHCIEGQHAGYRPGQNGDAVAFSFYATKTMSCGDGGALASNDLDLLEKVRVLRLHGMDKGAAERHTTYRHWDMLDLGYKANMNDLQASLLIPQLAKTTSQLARRVEVAARYDHAFSQLGLARPKIAEDVVHAHHLYTIWPAKDRDTVLAQLQSRQIGVAVNYNPVHLTTYYRKRYGYEPGRFPNAEKIGHSTISLPLYPGLTTVEQNYVIEAVKDATR